MTGRSNTRCRVLLMVSSMRGGGSERQVLMLLKTLDRNRFEPFLYVTERTGEFLDTVPNDVIIVSHEDCRDTGGMYFPGRALRQQVRYLEHLIAKHEIDLIYDRTFQMSMIAGAAAQRANVPRVATIVSPPEVALPLVESRFVELKRRRLVKSYAEADRVVAVSQQAARSAARYYSLADDSVTVIHNPVDLRTLQGLRCDDRKRSNPIRLICVGRMTAEKGHADLLQAMEISKQIETDDWKLRLVGDGILRQQLTELAHSLGLFDRVEFCGAMSNAANMIADSDALILPSKFEGMPNVVLEAMAIGTPVIATRAGGTIELERDEPTVFWANVGEPASIADALKRFVEQPEVANEHVAAALRLVESHHDLEKTTRKIEELLLEVIGRKD